MRSIFGGLKRRLAARWPPTDSTGSGLYDNLAKYNLPFPEAVFDLDFFRDTPKPFFLLASELLPGRHAPTKTHCFLRLLWEKGLLLRTWTQNIDGLERVAGPVPHLTPTTCWAQTLDPS